jgi:hypothetical protein
MIREKSHCTIFYHWIPETRNLRFSAHKSRSAGSIPVSPNRHGSTREQIIPPEPGRTCKLMRMTGSKQYSPVGTKPSPVWGSIFDQGKSQLHHFTIAFQKPGICADSWFLESSGKMVQLGFSLITRAQQSASEWEKLEKNLARAQTQNLSWRRRGIV